MHLPSLFCLGKSVIHISCAGVILPLHLNYIYVYIYLFLHHITVSALICLCILYNIIFGSNLSWEFGYISLLCMGYSTTALLLHMHLFCHFCEYYIYVYLDMFVYFIIYNPWLYSILLIL